jgi:beta-xylosidase
VCQLTCCVRLFTTTDNAIEKEDFNNIDRQLNDVEEEYDTLKFHVLKAGSEGILGMVTVDAQLQQANLLRRIARQTVKATHRLQSVRTMLKSETLTAAKQDTESG